MTRRLKKRYLKARICLQPRASLMVSPHLTALELSYSLRFKLLLSPLSSTRPRTTAFFMDLAGIAEGCQQCCNNQEYYSKVIASVITPAYGRLIPTGFSSRTAEQISFTAFETRSTVWQYCSPCGNSQQLTSQCWTQRGHQRTRRQERLLLSSLGFWLESVLLVCCCAQFSPDLGIFYWHTGPD